MHHNLENSPNWGRWSRELELLVDWLLDNDAMSDGDALRRLAELIRHAPHPDLAEGVLALEPTVIEHLLAAGAAETLALRFISADSGFFVSRGAAGEYLVSVVLADRGETTAAGTSLARAVVCALAMALSRPAQPAATPLMAQATAGATLH
ncbi:hypothetical protein [Novosphingobium rosa]|uniref:hypothetical protein n=1 Tax=Novosphingobium rosa TaxID=76978 RepID=UPI00083101C5|nr:hypothetical protein [Novosphingobium rosa]